MVFKRKDEEKITSEELLKKASRSKPAELKELLKQIEQQIRETEKKDRNLLTAKTIITSRLASMRSKGQIV
jgi:hypothetical protein